MSEADGGNGPEASSPESPVESGKVRSYGTFGGVFTPTLLTILGVIMYLREGWVIGNVGLLGGAAIILLSFGITAFTALSLSSIVTNIRIGAGGAFSIISQSLGLEVGGSVGVPLYLSQALAVSMYIFGFREGWMWLFPEHPTLVVDLSVFAVLFVIAFVSAGLAFRIQYLIMAVIGLSLVSVGWAAATGSMEHSVSWWGQLGSGDGDGPGFWVVFAVFFPASTGIMAGANMSGELKDPKRSIPLGTLWAVALSLVVYLLLAYWLARSATTEELASNFTVMIDRAALGPAVLAGLLGATFSSALSSMVGAPRILQALGTHEILPRGAWLARRTGKGEPRNALFLTGVIVLGALMLRDLNAVAPLITMFFLITYLMINAVVFIEQSLGLISFRPLLRIPRLVSLLGAVGCIFAMFIVNPTFSIVAVVVVLVIYGLLMRRQLRAPFGDVRSGLFVALAEWAAKRVQELGEPAERTWKADLLLPVQRAAHLQRLFHFVRHLAYPKGSLKIVGLVDEEEQESLSDELPEIAEDFRTSGVFASATIITAATFGENLRAGIETFGSAFFRPNAVLLTMPEDAERRAEMAEILAICHERDIGVLLLHEHPERGFGQRGSVNVWFTDRGPEWEFDLELDNQDLALLIGYKLQKNWDAELRFVARAAEPEERHSAEEFLRRVAEAARMPAADQYSTTGEAGAPEADLHILPLPDDPDFEHLEEEVHRLGATCLFARDSGRESAMV